MWNNQISLPFLQHHSVCIVHFSTNIVILFASCLDNTYPVQITVGGIEFTPETILCGVNTVVKQGSTVSLRLKWCHYCDIIMGMMTSQITSFMIVYSLFRHRSKKTSKLSITSLCEGSSPVTGKFLTQRASNMENVSIRWRHHALCVKWCAFCNIMKELFLFMTHYGNEMALIITNALM